MKIKNKTELRHQIKDSIGNTGSLDYVEFYHDGSWARMGCSTHSECCIARKGILTLIACNEWEGTIDYGITKGFQEIESLLQSSIRG